MVSLFYFPSCSALGFACTAGNIWTFVDRRVSDLLLLIRKAWSTYLDNLGITQMHQHLWYWSYKEREFVCERNVPVGHTRKLDKSCESVSAIERCLDGHCALMIMLNKRAEAKSTVLRAAEQAHRQKQLIWRGKTGILAFWIITGCGICWSRQHMFYFERSECSIW